jgi:methylenetetrahydrofolate reductase (NADPH)
MTLREIYSDNGWGLSFEVFPPKTPEGDAALRRTLRELSTQTPAFISCTYGAGGSTSKKTLEWCSEIQNQFSQVATAHLTCLDASTSELIAWLRSAVDNGVQNIMALRGDRPKLAQEPRGINNGLKYANQLVALIREAFPEMGVGVAGYPESHVESPDAETDLRNLAQKVEAGADVIFTQMFFENASFLRFRDRLWDMGVRVPIVPGIMPITEYDQIQRISALCGCSIPAALASKLENARHDRTTQFEIGVKFAIQQCQALLRENVPGMHFYVLNKSQSCLRILEELPRAGLHQAV